MSYPRICIQPSISSGKPTPALWSEIEAAMRQPHIQDICDQIKLLDGQDPDELSRLKRQLPVITPHACRFDNDGTRKSANAVPSGLVMLDIDHVAEPRRFYAEHIAPVLDRTFGAVDGRSATPVDGRSAAPVLDRTFGAVDGAQGTNDGCANGGCANSGSPDGSRERSETTLREATAEPSFVSEASQFREAEGETIVRNANKIYFVAVTPSGHGLRIIAERKPGESIPDAQRRIADLCRLPEYDAVTHDLARASFLMPWSYVLYCEPHGLDFLEAQDTEQWQQSCVDGAKGTNGGCAKSGSPDGSRERSETTLREATAEPSFVSGSESTFRGIPYATIIRELTNLLGGEPSIGERNQFYFTLVRYMRYICDFNVDKCVAVLPDFGLSLAERKTTASSSINRPRAGQIPDLLNRAIATAQLIVENEEATLETPETLKTLELPALPRVLELICRRLPEGFRPAMVIASLPILGTLATRVRFQYLDKQEHSFSFMSCITAPAATGKSFIRKPVNLLLTPIDKQDAIERAKEEEYKEALRASKNSKMQPTNPRACPRNNGINVSIAKLLQLLSYSDGKHLIGIGEEIDTLVKSERAGVWSQKSDIYRLGFDNAKYGQNYMSDASFSANVPVYYNLLLTGTPGGMYRFFKDVEDGLVTRFCFAQLPDMFGADIPAFENYTPKEEEEIIEIATRLDQAEGFIACSHVGTRVRRWLNDKRELAIRDESRATDTLRKRSAVIGYRAGMLAFLLNNQKYDKAVGEFATWVAEYVFQNQMQLFGAMFEEVAQEQIKVQERTSAVVSLLPQLPNTFTKSELMALRARNGQSTRVDMVLNRWRASGFIRITGRNTFEKTHKCIMACAK